MQKNLAVLLAVFGPQLREKETNSEGSLKFRYSLLVIAHDIVHHFLSGI